MKRIVVFALLATLVVIAFAFGFQNLVPGWYGELLFETCLLFGAVGLIAGFIGGLLARQASPTIILVHQALEVPTRPIRSSLAVQDALHESAFITRTGPVKNSR